ncbi:MAG TPA: protein kinase [Blastocatellia bacterium]|nr:protein kinase [Blastocatellia bacterium]
MTPELYERVYQICHEVLRLEVGQRAAFLDQACAGNAVLRREVEAMLAYEEREENLITGPALDQEVEALQIDPTAIMEGDRTTNDDHSSPPELSDETFAPGVMLGGRYLIEKELGHGGVCAVFLARDQKLHQTPVVIKVLLDIWQQTSHRAWLEKKFKGEITALSRIDHPGVVRALDVGKLPDGRSYLVMQYVAGVSLREVMTPAGMELKRVARLLRQMGQAVTAAHQQGVIHRDLKPENIMLQRTDDEEYVKLIDFGIATVYEMADAGEGQTTKVIGTRNYVAPEQLRGKPLAASDVYALGVIAYEMITGRRPFDSVSIFQLYELQSEGVKIKPCDLRPTLPEAAQAAVLKALSFAPQDRFSNAKDFVEVLGDALTGESERGWTPWRMFVNRKALLLVAALLAVVGVNVFAWQHLNFRNWAKPESARTALSPSVNRQLSYSMEAQRAPKRSPRNKPFATFENEILGMGDQVRFYLNSPQSGSLYVINEGSRQSDGLPSFTVLFPDTEISDSSPKIQGRQVVQIPLPSGNPQLSWFVLNREEGADKIWLVWSDRSVPELEAVKGWANPKDRGLIRDPKQRASVAQYFAAPSAAIPQVERDEVRKETRLKADGETLIWVVNLEYR